MRHWPRARGFAYGRATASVVGLSSGDATVGSGTLNIHRDSDAAVFGDGEEWVPSHLPQKPVRVGKVPGIAAPEGFLRRLKQYIGMDVHKEAIVIAVLNGNGKLVMESIVETKASSMEYVEPPESIQRW